jgi:hypothetical protein
LIAFYCEMPSRSGGETPLADTRNVLSRLSEPTWQRLWTGGYLYVRNFGGHFGLAWRDAFQVEAVEELEAYCRDNEITFQWLGVRGGKLRTRQHRRVIARHPLTGERTWLNHLAFFHPSSLDPDLQGLLTEHLRPEEYPHTSR